MPVIGRMNGNIDISQLNLYNVDHIEVIEGPMSVIYGSNALAGVINIITKENKNTRLSAFGKGYIESVGIYNFDLGASWKKKDHVFSLSGGRNFFDGYTTNVSLSSNRVLLRFWIPRCTPSWVSLGKGIADLLLQYALKIFFSDLGSQPSALHLRSVDHPNHSSNRIYIESRRSR